MSIVIIDASVAASWLFEDESDDYAATVLEALGTSEGVAPLLWQYELRNILLSAKRRNRITQHEMINRLAALAELPIRMDNEADLHQTFTIAEKHRLSFYDALYLELTLRLDARLASLDVLLVKAAKLEGVSYA